MYLERSGSSPVPRIAVTVTAGGIGARSLVSFRDAIIPILFDLAPGRQRCGPATTIEVHLSDSIELTKRRAKIFKLQNTFQRAKPDVDVGLRHPENTYTDSRFRTKQKQKPTAS